MIELYIENNKVDINESFSTILKTLEPKTLRLVKQYYYLVQRIIINYLVIYLT